jgi:N-acylneuraminate cytidylyltransferase
VIPARGGSKRIPQKNIRPFLGTPILVYSVRSAIDSGLFDEIVVSTDDPRIAGIAEEAGAAVPFYRSAVNSGDNAPSGAAVLEVLTRYAGMNKTFDTVACLYPTAPFMTSEKIREAVALFESTGCISLCTMTRFSFPPERGFLFEGGRARPWFPEKILMRSQDLREIYHDAGQLYLVRYPEFMRTGSLYSDNTLPYVVSALEAQDIDEETDWRLAELKYRLLNEKEPGYEPV